MREFKFRFWDTQNQRMIMDAPFLVRDKDSGKYKLATTNPINPFVPPGESKQQYMINYLDGEGIYPYEPAILMQYTGLKDSQGKEIYEGDIIYRPGVNIPMIVRWNVQNAGFDLVMRESTLENFETATIWYTRHSQDYEVIGNRYEHSIEIMNIFLQGKKNK